MRLIEDRFPAFGGFLAWRRATAPDEEWQDQILPAASQTEIAALEVELRVALPASYKLFLETTRGVTLWGGDLQMTKVHPFVHDFPPLDGMTYQQTFNVAKKREGTASQILCNTLGNRSGSGDLCLK
ncbi:MAG: SMI1/KNR4 family protein [Fibrella sp.]|nr:SMI1/KNR4 family protein [Armatimonadota bacterium]